MIQFAFAPLLWQQYAHEYQKFEEMERFISYCLISLSVLFTWVNNLWKFQRNLSGPTFEMRKYLSIKLWLTDFFYFSLLDRAYVYLFMCKISGYPTELLLQDHWDDMCRHLFAGAIYTRETNAHAGMHIWISKIFNFCCFNFL